MTKREMKIMLVVMVGGAIALVYALTQGDLWTAGVLALSVVVLSRSYRMSKRVLERRP